MKRKVILSLLICISIIASMAVISASMPEERARVIITVDDTFDEKVILAAGGEIVAEGKVFLIVVAELPAKAVKQVAKAKGVKRVERDAVVHILGKPSNPRGGKGGSSQPSQQIPWGIDRINATEAWSISNGVKQWCDRGCNY